MYKALTALILSVSFPVLAETAVSHIVVNQRWPWSEKVDVDFVLSGAANDVEVTATWDAHPSPYRLGTLFAAAPGQHRLTWDPASSPFRGQTLTGFSVSVSNAAASAHNYIVVDLVNGGYAFMAEPPSGGWTASTSLRRWSSGESPRGHTRWASRLRRSATSTTTIPDRSRRPTATAGP